MQDLISQREKNGKLHSIMNEDKEIPTFEAATSASYTDLTITNNGLAPRVRNWEIGEEGSCSDLATVHCVVKFQRSSCIAKEIFEQRFKSKLKKHSSATCRIPQR